MSKPRLLIIDDEIDICDLIADIADTRGFETSTVSNPSDVEARLGDFKPECIMMDLMMPGIDGVELLRTLGPAIKDCTIVLMSGHDARVLNSAKRLGSAHGLNIIATQEKPIDITALRATLDAMVQSSSKATSRMSDVNNDTVLHKDIAVFYQPLVDMETNRVRGMEALCRWNHPQHGILSPDLFLSKLDNDGMNELTRNVMEMAVRDTGLLAKKGHGVAVSINMTYSNLMDLEIPDRLDDLCKQHGVANDKINIEMTEGEAMRDVRHITDVLTRLRLRGFGLAIDDFGTGYSSLRELQRLPFNIMKMDKSFVLDMADNRSSQVITHAIIELGHNLGLKVVAEGVETAKVWAMLKERKCDLAQGYVISKPLDFIQLNAWLNANSSQFSL
jgi:EAL domain-containing protein (putative c-di-GMP-specific phosphodiesterase class I)